jgi:hypothetical protein
MQRPRSTVGFSSLARNTGHAPTGGNGAQLTAWPAFAPVVVGRTRRTLQPWNLASGW